MDIFEKDFTLSNSIGHIVNIVANRMKAELENAFIQSNYDITALQWMVLSIIYENDGITQNKLSQLSKKDKTNIARILEKLEKKGLVTKIKDDIDKRAFRLYLTNEGKHLKEELTQLTVNVLKKSTMNISKDEHAVCLNVLKKIYVNLE
jgi:DNA-binding MarR family transcriptional regulator